MILLFSLEFSNRYNLLDSSLDHSRARDFINYVPSLAKPHCITSNVVQLPQDPKMQTDALCKLTLFNQNTVVFQL